MYFQRKNRSDRDVLFIYLLLQINLFPVPATKEQCLAGCETRVSLQSDLVFHEENCFYYPSHSVSGSSKMMKLFSGRSVPISWPAQFRSMDSQMDSWTRQAGRLLARLTRSLGDVKSSLTKTVQENILHIDKN